MIDDIFTNIIDCHGNNTEQIKQEVSIYYLLQRMFIFLAFYDCEEVDVAEFLHDNPVSKPWRTLVCHRKLLAGNIAHTCASEVRIA